MQRLDLDRGYHTAIGGDLIIADAVKKFLPADAADYNQALSAAARDGHLSMTKWLFENGATNPNSVDAFGKTPLAIALTKGYADVADESRRHGGLERPEIRDMIPIHSNSSW